MTTFYFIHVRPVRVTGDQSSGWRMATDSDADVSVLPFEFSIADDGARQFLLAYRSTDGSLCGETRHETLDDVFEAAEQEFGIMRKDWFPA